MIDYQEHKDHPLTLDKDGDNSHMLALVERKMSPDDRKVWFRYIEAQKEEASFHLMLTWMDSEMKTRLRSSAPLRDGRSVAPVGHISEKDKVANRQTDSNCSPLIKCFK